MAPAASKLFARFAFLRREMHHRIGQTMLSPASNEKPKHHRYTTDQP